MVLWGYYGASMATLGGEREVRQIVEGLVLETFEPLLTVHRVKSHGKPWRFSQLKSLTPEMSNFDLQRSG